MKQVYFFLFIIFDFIGYAQDPQLFENTWYLHNVIVDGQDNIPPINDEVPFVALVFNETNPQFMTDVCNSAEGEVNFDPVNPVFNFAGELTFTLILCNDENNGIFEGLYFGFYNDDLTETFSYAIESGGGTKTMTITSASGDQAIYGDQILSRADYRILQFVIYPNPVRDALVLSSKAISGNLKIKIYNIEGKLLTSQSLVVEKQASIDVSGMPSGIYFLNIKTEKGRSKTKKFLKE